MADAQNDRRDAANPTVFVIKTRGARGAASVERKLAAYAGKDTGSPLLAIGPDEWLLARAVTNALKVRFTSNMGTFLWLSKQPGVRTIEMLRGRVAMKRWHDNQPPATPRMDPVRSRRSAASGATDGWYSWNVKMVGAPEAWDMMGWDRKSEPPWRQPSIKVGHMDTGIAPHTCLDLHDGTANSTGHILMHEGANTFDADAHGSLPHDPLLPHGTPGHGLRTLSVLCGHQKDRFSGVAPRANIVPFRVTNFVVVNALVNTNTGLAEGIRRATIDKGCRVLSISLGDPCFPGALTGQAVDRAYEMGVIIVAAAGNITSEVTFPGRYARTIGVGGVSENGRPWSGGSYGHRVDLSAPADNVYRALCDVSNHDREGYSPKDGDGTSYATTHVSAAAVMWLAHHGDEIERLYGSTWRRVEAFRTCVRQSAKAGPDWDSANYGAGILWIPGLLTMPLPDPSTLTKVNDLAVDDLA